MNYSEHVADNDLLNSPTGRGTRPPVVGQSGMRHLIELNDEA